ncbi:MAG: hypothetical protein JSS11_08775 [Verrucomicrobia bacterium]|nr:hypothetical protein [Verrucomicrobiota bacterium]
MKIHANACLSQVRWLIVGGLGLFTGALAAADPSVAKAVEIGSRLEPMVDEFLVDRRDGVELRLQTPHSEGIVFTFDQPWEGGTSGYTTVFKDGDRYRMYYRGSADLTYSIKATVTPDEKAVPTHSQFACYAESTDGIHWTRPKLGLFEFNGSKDNNIVWVERGSHNFSPFKDDNPAAPADQRYKAVASSNNDNDKRKPILIAFVSADGVHWRKLRDEPIITDGAFDSLNRVFWDAPRQEYVAIYRDFIHGVRSIKFAHSKDFVTWTPGEWADFGDAPEENLYTNAAAPYARAPQLFFALPRRFLPWKTYFPEMAASSPGTSDVVFMSSRDGVRWHRFEEAFLRPGLHERNWAHRANTPAAGLLSTGPEEISFYVERDYTFPTNRLERFTVRPDGFVAMHAGYPGGEFTTKPLIFTGSSLVLNYSTSASGSIRIEIQDAAGHPLPGFSLEESPLIFGDKIAEAVDWRHAQGRTDHSPLKHLAGKPVRLRFVMRDADLFALQFKTEPVPPPAAKKAPLK